jgi:hypothetical protein
LIFTLSKIMVVILSIQAEIISFVAGGALHVLFFRHGEWDLWAAPLVGVLVVVQASLFAYLTVFHQPQTVTAMTAFKSVSVLGTCLVSGIIASMLVYRMFFHRLNKFPGPTLARLSNFYPTYLSAKNLHLYEETEKLHHEYGDFVRLGTKIPYPAHALGTNTYAQVHRSYPSFIQRLLQLSTPLLHPAQRDHGTMSSNHEYLFK